MSTPRGYRDLAAGIGLVLALVPASAGDEPPRFEGGVEVVAIDANVVDGKGRPIPDLTAEEFVVRVDGKPRRVLSAELVRVDGGASPVEPATAGVMPPPSVPLALRPAARLFVLVVDRGQIEGSVDQAATSASRLLDQLGPGDRVAVFTLPSGPRLEFTADRAAVESVLRKIGPIPHRFMGEFNISYAEALALQGGRSRSSGVVNRECEQYLKMLEQRPHAAESCEQRVEQEARRQVEEHESSVEDRLNALESLCRNLAQVPGTKSLVLISGGFTAALADGRAKVAHQLRDITSAAAASKVNFYSIYFSHRVDAFDASRAREQFTPEQDRRLQSAGLEELTGMTGGAFYEAVAGANFAFERVASETSAHYLLGLEPGRSDRDGKPHSIDVKVLRKGAEVRARRQFVMEASAGRPFARVPTVPPAPRSPLRVSTHVLRGDLPEQIKVLMTAQVDGFADARFDIKILDPRGATVGALTEQVTPEDGGPVRHQETIVLPRGLYTLKAEALESGGRHAMIEAPLNAELGHAAGFDLSDLMLLEPANGALRLSAAAAIASDRMGIYLEVYVQDQLPTDQLAVTVEVVDARGARRSSTLASVREDPAKGLVYAEGVVDLTGLPPGGYVARAVVTSGLKVARRVERAFTIAAADRAAVQPAKASRAR